MTCRTCPVCAARDPRPFASRNNHEFVRCTACQCIYQPDPPSPEELSAIYSDNYHVARGHSGDPSIETIKQNTFAGYIRRLNEWQPSGRRLLEVGCSTGAGLAAAATLGWEAHGLDVSAAAARIASERPGIASARAGTIEDAGIADGSFDAITLFDVIEHIDPPGPMLQAARRVLRSRGLILMVTPDAGSVSASLLKSRWPHLFPEHLVLYSRDGMRRLLSSAGFEVLQIGFAWKRVNLEMLVRHARLHSHVFMAETMLALGQSMPAFLLTAGFPFNIGEFYVIARRAED